MEGMSSMTKEMKERWAEEITADLKNRSGLSVKDIESIDAGWLNVKWKMETEYGPIFVKFYHPGRYKIHTNPKSRDNIEKTLQLQHGLNAAGIPCPSVLHYKGKYIRETASGLFYTVLEWVDGHTTEAGHLSAPQMFELGSATGRMHKWLQFVPPLQKPAWKPDREAYLQEWHRNWEIAHRAGDQIVMEWLQRSGAIVRTMDFSVFEQSATGWLHWDLWVDNILLKGEGLAGIVDFDRMTMAYQEIDVARAILSGSLRDEHLRMDTAQAFIEGYRKHLEVPHGMLTRAMRMLYLIESIWWLRTEVRRESELRSLLSRFVQEMHWIEENWATLPEQLDAI
jgi:homoserine kinase type II